MVVAIIIIDNKTLDKKHKHKDIYMSDTKSVKGWVPFTLYDFFGYLFPGMILGGGIILYYNSIIINSQFYNNFKIMYKDFSGLFSVMTLLLGLVVVYVIGHFVATISHITIDRIVVGTILRYPYSTLLKISEKERKIVWPMHKLILVLLMSIWVLSIITIFIPKLQLFVVFFIYALLFILVLRIIFMLIKAAFPSIKKYEPNTSVWWYKLFIGWHSKLIDSIIINPIRQFLSIDKCFDVELASNIKKEIQDRFFVNCNNIESDNFWLPCLDILKNPIYDRMINNWLHLYGLSRNLCMSFFLLSAFAILNHYLIKFRVSNFEQVFIFLTIIGAAVFGVRYVMLYYTYYSKNVFRFFYIERTENKSA